MDRRHNPYAPGAGLQPPELAGRDRLIDEATADMDRLLSRRSAHSQSRKWRDGRDPHGAGASPSPSNRRSAEHAASKRNGRRRRAMIRIIVSTGGEAISVRGQAARTVLRTNGYASGKRPRAAPSAPRILVADFANVNRAPRSGVSQIPQPVQNAVGVHCS